MNVRVKDTTASGEFLRVGDLARLTGKTVRAVHYYEELGLLRPAGYTKGGFRLYSPSAIRRVEGIAHLQRLGMSLEEIQKLASVWESSRTGSTAFNNVGEFIGSELVKTREMIDQLKVIEKQLEESMKAIQVCESCRLKPERDLCSDCQSRSAKVSTWLVEAFCS